MNASPSASVEFELTPEEWAEISLVHSDKQPQVRKAMRNVRALFGIVMMLLALLSVLDGATGGALLFLLGGIVGMAVLGPLLRSSRRKQMLQYARTGIANGMFGPHRVELRPEGMLDVTEGYEWLTHWSAIDRVEEGEGAFLIYTGPNALLPIPHSAFRDSASLRRFSQAFFTLRQGHEARRLAGAYETGSPRPVPGEPTSGEASGSAGALPVERQPEARGDPS